MAAPDIPHPAKAPMPPHSSALVHQVVFFGGAAAADALLLVSVLLNKRLE
jgi:hypothetical protein